MNVSTSSAKQTLSDYLRAGTGCICVRTWEEGKFDDLIREVATERKRQLYNWTCVAGITKMGDNPETAPETENPMAALQYVITNIPRDAVIVFKDLHPFLGIPGTVPDPALVRALKNAIVQGKGAKKTVIIEGYTGVIPAEVSKMVVVMDIGLPDRETLTQLLTIMVSNFGKARPELKMSALPVDNILDALAGLTADEAEQAIAYSVVKTGTVSAEIIHKEKAASVKQGEILEIMESDLTLDDVGGLDVLKESLYSKRNLFSKAARDYGIKAPGGFIAVGDPGTGKSLISKVTGGIFKVPLVRLDASRLFGSLVGETERNWRRSFDTIMAISPCVVWIDEVDGLMSGGASSGQTDGGTTQRTIKQILIDMQASTGVFWVCTCNNIDSLPAPFVDRLELWAVNLPNKKEREAIWSITIKKSGRNPAEFDVANFARSTEGFSGRQISRVWDDAMAMGFNAGRPSPTDMDVANAMTGVVPTSVSMGDEIARRKARLQGKAKLASRPEVDTNPLRTIE